MNRFNSQFEKINKIAELTTEIRNKSIIFENCSLSKNHKDHIEFLFFEFNNALKKELEKTEKPNIKKNKNKTEKVITTGHPHHIKTETVDLIFNDLYERRNRLQQQVFDLQAITSTEEKLMITDVTKHSIFVFKEEIQNMLKIKLYRTKKKLENENFKIIAFNIPRKN